MSCKHKTWLRISRNSKLEIQVQVTDQFSRLLGQSRGKTVAPGVALLLGGKLKDEALENLGVTAKSALKGELHLHSVGDLASAGVIIAEGAALQHCRNLAPWRSQQCHEVHDTILTHETRMEKGIDRVYNHLVLPFVDIVCIFVDDLGGLRATAQQLKSWINDNTSSCSPLLPEVLLVAKEENASLGNFMRYLGKGTWENRFSRFKLVKLSKRCSLRTAEYDTEKPHWDVFLKQLTRRHKIFAHQRVAKGCSFSAVHVDAFFRMATRSLDSNEPIDFIKMSRASNPVPEDMAVCFSQFLRTLRSMEKLRLFAIPVIASTIIFDQYPPGMHRKFPLYEAIFGG